MSILSNFTWEMIVPFLPIVIVCATGYYLKDNPPKKINKVIGYRTKRSMNSQDAWDFAQLYSSKLLFTWSAAAIVGILAHIILTDTPSLGSIVASSTAVLVLIIIGVIYYTEKELKLRFKKNDEK